MKPEPALIAEDRHFLVPQDHIVKTDYVRIEDVKLACRDRMAVGDVEVAYRRRLQLGNKQPFPCPYGYWEGDRFVLVDGRHDYVACLMIGHTHILVAWLEREQS